MSRMVFTLILTLSSLIGQNTKLRVEHPPIDEQSAIVKSLTYPDVFWVCNDSGNEAAIFALNSKGEIIMPDFVRKHYDKKKEGDFPGIKISGAICQDWEAMTVLGDTLIIADMGNNGNARRDLGIYLVPEPNPHSVTETRPLVWLPIHYPDQDKYPATVWEYDCESIFVFQGMIYFLTKHRGEQNINKPVPSTKLYRLETRYTNKSNVLKYIGRKENLGGWVTDANITPDESGMILLAQNPFATVVWYFPKPKRGVNFLSESPKSFRLLKADQAEGVCFKDANTIIVTNEQRDWFEISLLDFSE
ncbi:MAG: hypothetical protein HQ507_10830 [Candidatus Marinimicrobia bacterium]|nr:hypothetical protein [Candidatus Neomarinimicrobiota bacterium]